MHSFRIEWLDEVDSTNRALMARIASEDEPGLVLAARQQSSGRGRFEREWHSPPGGLWVSAHLRLTIPTARVSWITALGALSIAAALEQVQLNGVIRWPNDITIQDRKIAGVLAESRKAGLATDCVLGMGINVNLDRSAFPGELKGQVTSMLIEAEREFDLDAVLVSVLQELRQRVGLLEEGRTGSLKDEWQHRSGVIGRTAEITLPDSKIQGTVQAVALGEGLVVEAEDGAHRIRGEHVEHFQLLE